MRTIEFKMERTGLLNIGDVLDIQEFELPNSYYYVLGHAYAMSGNFKTLDRLKTVEGFTKGTVSDIKETPKGFFVMVDVED